MTTNTSKSFTIKDNLRFYSENIHLLSSSSELSPLEEELVASKGSLVLRANPNGEGELWIKTGDLNTNWASFPIGAISSGSVWDTDNDTGIHVEKNPDEDIIRLDIAGQEIVTIESTGLTVNNIKTKTILDTDLDTGIHIEKNSDEDIIRLDIAGDEKFKLDASGLELNSLNGGGMVKSTAGLLSIAEGGNDYIISVAGTDSRITVSNSSGNLTIDIDSTYAGQNSITTLGTIGYGYWQGSPISITYGGTGNTSFTNNTLIYFDGTHFSSVTQGTDTQVLKLVSGVPTWVDSSILPPLTPSDEATYLGQPFYYFSPTLNLSGMDVTFLGEPFIFG